jgi:hypothetical protein
VRNSGVTSLEIREINRVLAEATPPRKSSLPSSSG